MTLYQATAQATANHSLDNSRNWITELDSRGLELGRDIKFEYGKNLPLSPELNVRIELKWAQRQAEVEARGGNIYDGPLARFDQLRQTENGLALVLSKTTYKEHHGTMPLEGKDDAWTLRHRPYNFEKVSQRVLHARIPYGEELAAAFAMAIFTETADGKVFVGVRNNLVDTYAGQWSFPSGGRISGNPHQVVDDVVRDAILLEGHAAQVLMMEFPGVSQLLSKVHDVTMLGLARSLADLDITCMMSAQIDATADELANGILAGKYTQAHFVPSNADGMVELIQNSARFPSTIVPTFVMMAQQYGVNPSDVDKNIVMI